MISPLLRSTLLVPIALAFATPLVAQATCGGLDGNGQWLGGSEAASDIATADTHREQMALVLGASKYVSVFTLSEPATVRIEAQGRGAGDPLLDLYTDSGDLIVSDDDSGGNGAARVELELDAGKYCVSTFGYDGAPLTAFVRVGRAEHEALTDGIEVTSGATSQGGSTSCSDGPNIGTVSEPIFYTGSVDTAEFLRFTLDTPKAVTITAENEDADPIVTLFDSSESNLGENDDYDGLNSRLDITDVLPAGDYCIGLQALNDTSVAMDIRVSEYDPNEVQMLMFRSGEAAPPLDGSIEITDLGDIPSRLRHDLTTTGDASWLSVNIPEAGALIVEAIATGDGDPWLVIFDDLGRKVALNDDNFDGLNSLATARVVAGTYFVGVKQVDDQTGLVRLVFERFVPAK